MDKDKKIRVLALCDSPTSATGFAQVSRNILKGLADTGKYEIDVIGINYQGDYYDRNKHPYNIYPACPQGYQDIYGRGRVINALSNLESKNGLVGPWDILYTIQDPFIVEGLGFGTPFGEHLRVTLEMFKRSVPPGEWFKWIGYFPVDADVKENWVTRAMALPNYTVAYCEWGKKQMLKFDREKFDLKFNLTLNEDTEKKKATFKIDSLKDRISVIHHGIDLGAFFPVSKKEREAFREKFFKGLVKKDTFLIVNISRNQPRKDLARTLKGFAEFKKKVPNSHLYLHCQDQDAGGSIQEIARNFNLIVAKDYSLPSDFSANTGYGIDVINNIYNAADACVTTTLGEGWGFITTEAMATKTPIVAPWITSMIDIFGGAEGEIWSETMRGVPVIAGSNSSEWVCLGLEDNERIRPLTNVDDLVDKLYWVYRHPEEAKKMTERAYEWVKTNAWPIIIKQWDELFMNVYEELEKERELGRSIDKAGRNDPCPCGSGLKFKKCHGSNEQIDKYRDWIETEEK